MLADNVCHQICREKLNTGIEAKLVVLTVPPVEVAPILTERAPASELVGENLIDPLVSAVTSPAVTNKSIAIVLGGTLVIFRTVNDPGAPFPDRIEIPTIDTLR